MEDTLIILSALADQNRLRIMTLLMHAGELCVCDIERVLRVPQARVSRHLGALRAAGLATAERRGQWMHYRPTCGEGFRRALCRQLKKALADDPLLQEDLRMLGSTPLSCGRDA
jgi:ArsR family transcriptional regulator, arsenate/arsenite/antimonite-responsive transcriptional repressor